MQTMRWYWDRLSTMSTAELAWRVRGKFRTVGDRFTQAIHRRPIPLTRIADPRRATLCQGALGVHLLNPPSNRNDLPDWVRNPALFDEAEKIASGDIRLFGRTYSLGKKIDWNYEPEANRRTPMTFSPAIDYRDHREVGDCKLVWELNRHAHLVVLARAYWAFGEERFAEAAWSQWDRWIHQCPYGLGMNWRSPLELAIRLINWVWLTELTQSSKAFTETRRQAMICSAWRHLWAIQREYSQFSSANNHRIGEAAGVFIASTYFCGLKEAAGWRKKSRSILLQEIQTQTWEDGGTREQAWGYQEFVGEFFTLASVVARNTEDEFPVEFWNQLEKLYSFLARFMEGGPLPMIGDADDGYILDLGGSECRTKKSMSVAATIFSDPAILAQALPQCERTWWLLGQTPLRRSRRKAAAARTASLPSLLSPSGYALLQCGSAGDRSASVIMDCGELGFGTLAAHGHADALSIVLRVDGRDVLIDPGTYDYFSHPKWREYFRSTRAHNTVAVDGESQSESAGKFLWNRRAEAQLLHWQAADDGGIASATHDGYMRLSDPVRHSRTIVLAGARDALSVVDEFTCAARHAYEWNWHFSESCVVRPTRGNRVIVEVEGIQLDMALPDELDVRVIRGGDSPIRGWVSRGYHQRTPSPTIVAKWTGIGTRRFETSFLIRRTACTIPDWSTIGQGRISVPEIAMMQRRDDSVAAHPRNG